ncbi:MAG: VCBS repeat-containing protein [Alphaproteobacteria bacterium]|nr:MAG: VCBS repeat-containing protein [Alphaproteobacteria bacterium]
MINDANAADFDGDGHVDVIASFGGRVWVFAGPRHERKFQVHRFGPGPNGRKLRPGCIHACLLDVDDDGDLDYIGSNNHVFWLECPDRPMSGAWKYHLIDGEILGTHCVLTADVDRDGRADLIANSGRAAGTPFPNSLTWLERPRKPRQAREWIRHVFGDRDAPGGSHYCGFGDVNGDGRGDIAYGAKGGEGFPGGQWFAWWEQPQDPKRPWKKHLLSDRQPGATNIQPIDLNGDGATDFFATRGHGRGALWFKGPEFEAIEIDPDIEKPHSLALGDIDGDGDPDAVTCGYEATGQAVWYENDGSGRFTRHLIAAGQGSYDTRLVDLDRDGDLDVLIAGHFSRNLVWFENPLRN